MTITPDPSSPSFTGPRVPPALVTLLTLAAAIVVIAGLSLGREIVGPLALGAVITVICHPIRHPLERAGWPRWLATTAVVVLAYLILAALLLMLTFAVAWFVDLIPQFADELTAAGNALERTLHDLGLDQAASDATASALDPARIASYAQTLGGTALSVLTAFFFVLAYVIFMAADASRSSHADEHYGPEAAPALRRFQHLAANVRRYYVVNATFGAVVAVLDGVALALLGVPAPVVWAILSFVTNFVPNIGFVLGVVPPAVLALVVGGWPLMLAVIAVYSVINVVLQVLVQPKFVADAVNISLTLSFFSVIFWSFVIGPLGAILSIPLTLLARAALLERDPGARWLRWLAGDDDAAPVRERERGDVPGEPEPPAPEPPAPEPPAPDGVTRATPSGADEDAT